MTPLESPAVSIQESLTTVLPAQGDIAPKVQPKGRDPLALPTAVDRTRIDWGVIAMFGAIHVLALSICLPWLFSWSAVVVTAVGCHLIGMLGINVCYHRLLTHRSFTTPRWFERVLTCLAFCNMEGSSIRWIATHRMHHQHSDHQPDPHSPLVNFLWAHLGWMVIRNRDIDDYDTLSRYAGDLARDPFHVAMHHSNKWLLVWLLHIGVVFGGGFAWGYLAAEADAAMRGLQLGLSWVAWGVMFRTVFVWHITWAINSITHLWGYKNYKTTDDSRNNWLFGFLAFGEGWHNNHHADQRSAAAGHKWWEFDISYLTIRLFSLLGLARNIITPARNKGTTHDIVNKKLSV